MYDVYKNLREAHEAPSSRASIFAVLTLAAGLFGVGFAVGRSSLKNEGTSGNPVDLKDFSSAVKLLEEREAQVTEREYQAELREKNADARNKGQDEREDLLATKEGNLNLLAEIEREKIEIEIGKMMLVMEIMRLSCEGILEVVPEAEPENSTPIPESSSDASSVTNLHI